MERQKSILYILITAFCFGTMEVALKLGGGSFSALQMTFLRFLIGGIFLLPFAIRDLKKRQLRLNVKDWGYLLLLAVIGICISMTCFQIGVMHSNANTASVIISMNPVFTMIFAYLIIGEAFTARKALVLLISVTGLVFVANPVDMAAGNTVSGILYNLIATITFALFTALGKLRIGRLGGTVQNSFTFLMASVIELAILLFRKEPVFQGIHIDTLPVILYTGIVVTGIGYFAYLKAIEMAGPSHASIAFFIKPVIAVTAAAIILREAVTWNIVLGVALIICGSVINLRGQGERKVANTRKPAFRQKAAQ